MLFLSYISDPLVSLHGRSNMYSKNGLYTTNHYGFLILLLTFIRGCQEEEYHLQFKKEPMTCDVFLRPTCRWPVKQKNCMSKHITVNLFYQIGFISKKCRYCQNFWRSHKWPILKIQTSYITTTNRLS